MSIADKLTTVAENVPQVYDKGVENGKKLEHDAFWGDLQNGGNRTDYSYLFASFGSDCFYPKYNMQPTLARAMFQNFGVRTLNQEQLDLQSRLEECGVTLDFSKCTDMVSVFQNTNMARIGTIDTTGAETLQNVFYGVPYLRTIENLILKTDGTQKFTTAINNAWELVDITISGKIGNNGLSFAQSQKLSKSSITSVVNALSATTSGLTITFSKKAVNNAFEIDVDNEGTFPEGSEFYILRNSKSNWTFNYA